MNRNRLLLVPRVALGLLFVYAAVSKVPDLREFAEEVANYRIIPPATVPYLATILPGMELVAGVLLITGVWVRAAGVLLSLFLAVFIVALSQALLRGIDLRCGCFGGSEVATWGTVLRDVVLLVGCLAVAWMGGRSSTASAMASRAVE
jgi:uncharacterized membrane protein YphA (DoxX/SURF4 family)